MISRKHITAADILVTTPPSSSSEEEHSAQLLADRLGCIFRRRRSHSISRLVKRNDVTAALVAGEREIYFVHGGRRFGFHPNMALQRLAAIGKGQKDRLIEVAGLKPGDRFLDCTCGMGTDAIVASHVVGERGCVRAVEQSSILAAIIGCGLGSYHHKNVPLLESMRRIKLINNNSSELLSQLDSGSWDVVYFDPMFEEGFSDAISFDLIHLLGVGSHPGEKALEEAKRVAKRCVVIKDRAPGDYLKTMRIPIVSEAKRVWYGRLGT